MDIPSISGRVGTDVRACPCASGLHRSIEKNVCRSWLSQTLLDKQGGKTMVQTVTQSSRLVPLACNNMNTLCTHRYLCNGAGTACAGDRC